MELESVRNRDCPASLEVKALFIKSPTTSYASKNKSNKKTVYTTTL